MANLFLPTGSLYFYGANVGVGTTTPAYTLQVSGSFAAVTKSFVIPHPTKKNKQLRYSSLEGPENGVYFRGKLVNDDVILLPDYWSKLVDLNSITVDLTPHGKHQKLYVKKIMKTKIQIGSEDTDINCFYTIYAERKDVPKLEVEI
jgi:hypothetical protein